jgi:UDP-N-acetylmuramoyl-tripeptide--D-alanyl-D-alanine ligase
VLAADRTAQGRAFLPGEGAVRDALLQAGLVAARRHRRRLSRTTFVGVTGSVGKTTTKDLVAAVLGTRLTGTKSPGSENRLTTVGQTILRTKPHDGFAVVEIPAWYPGSVAELTRLVRPRIGVVTRIGADHRSLFRTLDVTAAEKAALLAGLPPDGVAILNADDPYVIAMADRFPGRVVSFGTAAGATLRAEEIRSPWPDPLDFTLRLNGSSLPVRTRLYGKHWATSVLAALGVALALEVPLERALEAVASFEPVAGRMSHVRQDGVTFIRDDAKAPLWTFDGVLEFLAEARAERKILVVGTLSDYPGASRPKYTRLAERALAVVDEVVFVGPNAHYGLRAPTIGSVRAFGTAREAAEHFRATLHAGDLVLVKGSHRADHLSRIVLDRLAAVRCWRDSCRRAKPCEDCRLLRLPSSAREAIAGPRD